MAALPPHPALSRQRLCRNTNFVIPRERSATGHPVFSNPNPAINHVIASEAWRSRRFPEIAAHPAGAPKKQPSRFSSLERLCRNREIQRDIVMPAKAGIRTFSKRLDDLSRFACTE